MVKITIIPNWKWLFFLKNPTTSNLFFYLLYVTSSAAGPIWVSLLMGYEVVYFFFQITFFKSIFCVESISELKNSKK